MRFFAAITLPLVIAVSPVAAEMIAGAENSATIAEKQVIPTRADRLESLYQRLAATADQSEAQGILRQIERIQLMSGSPTADLLLERVGVLVGKGDLPLASELFESILRLTPEWPEAWYRRAVLFQMTGDNERAIVALIKTLSLEPRHLHALEMLGALYSGRGENENALKAYRLALDIYPGSEDVRNIVRQLSLKVDGKDI